MMKMDVVLDIRCLRSVWCINDLSECSIRNEKWRRTGVVCESEVCYLRSNVTGSIAVVCSCTLNERRKISEEAD